MKRCSAFWRTEGKIFCHLKKKNIKLNECNNCKDSFNDDYYERSIYNVNKGYYKIKKQIINQEKLIVKNMQNSGNLREM